MINLPHTAMLGYRCTVSSGSLSEVGTGADGIQPSEVVGSWTVIGNQISYTYTGDGSSYAYTVHPIAGGYSYEFCLGGTSYKATGTID